MFSLTLTHLRFTVEALTPIRLGGYEAGMRRAFCAEAFPSPTLGEGAPAGVRAGA